MNESRLEKLETLDAARAFVLYAACRASAKHLGSERELFQRLAPRAQGHLATLEKAATEALVTGDLDLAPPSLAGPLGLLVSQRDVPGQLSRLRRVPFNTRAGTLSTTAEAAFLDEGEPAPVVRPIVGQQALTPKRVAAIYVTTREFERTGSIAPIQEDLITVLARGINTAFDGIILAGLSPVATLDADGDLAALIAAVRGGQLLAPAFVTDTIGALHLASLTDASGARKLFPDVSLLGGTILGAPLLISTSTLVAGKLVLLDQAAVLTARGMPSVDRAEAGALQMDDSPTNDSATATATQMVSMFQTDSIALKTAIRFNAAKAVADAAAYVTLAGGSPS